MHAPDLLGLAENHDLFNELPYKLFWLLENVAEGDAGQRKRLSCLYMSAPKMTRLTVI